MFILRTIHENDHGEIISDKYRQLEDFHEMVDLVERIKPHKYQCFDANEITNEVFMKLKIIDEEVKRRERKELFEELKKEFE